MLSDFWTHGGSPVKEHASLKQSGAEVQSRNGKLLGEMQGHDVGDRSLPKKPLASQEQKAKDGGTACLEQAGSTARTTQPGLPVLATKAPQDRQPLAGLTNLRSSLGEGLDGHDATSGHLGKATILTNAPRTDSERDAPAQSGFRGWQDVQGGDVTERMDDGQAGGTQKQVLLHPAAAGNAGDSTSSKPPDCEGASEDAPRNPGQGQVGAPGNGNETGNPGKKTGGNVGNPGRASRRPHRVLYLRGWPPDDLVDVAGPRAPFLIKLRDFAVSHSLPWPLDGPFRGAQGTPDGVRVRDDASPASVGTEREALPSSLAAPAAGLESPAPNPPSRTHTAASQAAAESKTPFQFALDEPNLATPILQSVRNEASAANVAGRAASGKPGVPGRVKSNVAERARSLAGVGSSIEGQRSGGVGGQGIRGNTRGVGFGVQGSLVLPGGPGGKARATKPIAHRAKSLWERATERALVLRRTVPADSLEAVSRPSDAVVPKTLDTRPTAVAGIEPAPSAPERLDDTGSVTDGALPAEALSTAVITVQPDSARVEESAKPASSLEPNPEAPMEQGQLTEPSPAGPTDEAQSAQAFAQQALDPSSNSGDAAVHADQTPASPSGEAPNTVPGVESKGEEGAEIEVAGAETSGDTGGTSPHKGDLEAATGVKKDEAAAATARRESNLRQISPIYPDPAVMYDHSAVTAGVDVSQSSSHDSKAASADGVAAEKEDRPSIKTSKLKRSHSSPSIKARYGEAEQAAVEPRYKPAPVEQVARAFPLRSFCLPFPVFLFPVRALVGAPFLRVPHRQLFFSCPLGVPLFMVPVPQVFFSCPCGVSFLTDTTHTHT